MKLCPACGAEKPLDAFYRNRRRHDGRQSYCKPCQKARVDPRVARASEFRKKYGITLDDFDQMLERQQGRCAICGDEKASGKGSFHVDHCHASGRVRGLLCHHCNLGLGQFRDSATRLRAAIGYLDPAPAPC